MRRTNWERFGADVAPLLKSADWLRRARERAERALASGDGQRILEAAQNMASALAAEKQRQEQRKETLVANGEINDPFAEQS